MHFMDESFWIAVSFIIFLYFAYRPIKKAIIQSLDAKIEEVKKHLEETEKLKQEASDLLTEVKEEMVNFEARRTQILESAEASTTKFIDLRAKEIELSLLRIKDSAVKTIENRKSVAAAELRNQFIDSVMTMVKDYLIKSGNNSVSDQEIIDKFMKKNKRG